MAETPEHIMLKLQAIDQGVVEFRIKRQLPLGELKEAYCGQLGLEQHKVRLSFDGEPIDANATAASLQLEEGDMLEVVSKAQPNDQDGAGDIAEGQT